jgi:hypothetical protein
MEPWPKCSCPGSYSGKRSQKSVEDAPQKILFHKEPASEDALSIIPSIYRAALAKIRDQSTAQPIGGKLLEENS